MNDKQKFKDWLKENYSCFKCHKKCFVKNNDRKEEKIKVHGFEKWDFKDNLGILCLSCHEKEKVDKKDNGTVEFVEVNFEKTFQEFYKAWKKSLRNKPLPINVELKKIIEYTKQTNKLAKCSQCQNYSFSISPNGVFLIENFHILNDKKFCPKCFGKTSLIETAYKIGYEETRYFLYDLWEAWKNKGTVAEKSSYEEKANPNQKDTQIHPVSPPQNPELERKGENKVSHWMTAFLVVCLFLSLIFLAIFALSKSKRK